MAGQEVEQSSRAEPKFFYGYIVVAAALCIMVLTFGTYFVFGIFFNPVLTEFGWTRAMTSGAFSLSMMVMGLMSVMMGGLNDRLGPRVVLTLCGFLLGIGFLLMSQISAVWQLYLFYGLILGIGMSGTFVPLMSTVARWFVRRRGIMSGIVMAGSGIGGLIGPPVANWLISAYEWRMSYIILGIIVLVVVVLAAQFLKRDPAKIGQFPYGENRGGQQGLELGAEGSSLKEAISTRQFWMVFATFFCLGFCRVTPYVHLPPNAIDLGFSAASAANIMAAVGGVSIVGRVVLGSAADKIGNKQAFIIGIILLSAALFWLVPAAELWMLYLFAVVFGFAHGGLSAIESPLVAWLFGLGSHGLLFGVMSFGFTSGGAIGPFLTGYLFDVTDSYQVASLVSAALGIAGLVLTALLTPIRDKSEQNKVSSPIA